MESILDALDLPAGDEVSDMGHISPVNTEEYDRYMKELEDDAGEDEVNSTPGQILTTLAAFGNRGSSEETPPDARIPALEAPPAPPRTNIRPVDQLIARNLG